MTLKKLSYLNEEVNCTEPFPLASVPCRCLIIPVKKNVIRLLHFAFKNTPIS